MTWIEVRARFDSAWPDWSPVLEVFRDHGIENTLEDELTLSGCFVGVEGVEQHIAALRHDLLKIGAAEVTDQPIQEVNWEEAWKAHFKPRRIGQSLVVCPSWEAFEPQAGDKVITLDPGQAFGTGDHATTRMCLAYLEEFVKPEHYVLDLGCGSGILAIAAKLLGAVRVSAIDIDPISVEVTKANALRNGVGVEASVGDVLELRPERGWDVVVSNIISATLINLAPDAKIAVKSGGHWIVSGIILQNWPDVKKAAEQSGFELLRHQDDEGWVAAIFLRP